MLPPSLLALLLYVWTAAPLFSAESNEAPEEPSSSLRPPRGEILPTFWEQHGTWVALGGVLLLALIGLGIWAITRPKRPVIVPAAVQARQALEPLRQQPETGVLLSRVSQILRRYIAAAFELPAGEPTTSEFCRALLECEKIGPELASEISDFLRECDLRKFAPSPPSTPFGAIDRSLSLIEHAESRLATVHRVEVEVATRQGLSNVPRGASGG